METIVNLLEQRIRFDYAAVKSLASPEKPTVPVVAIGVPDLKKFDALLGGAR